MFIHVVILAGSVMSLACTQTNGPSADTPEITKNPYPASSAQEEDLSATREALRPRADGAVPVMWYLAAGGVFGSMDATILDGPHLATQTCWKELSKEERVDRGFQPTMRPFHEFNRGDICELGLASDAAKLIPVDPGHETGRTAVALLEDATYPWAPKGSCAYGTPTRDANIEMGMNKQCPAGAFLLVEKDQLLAEQVDEYALDLRRKTRDADLSLAKEAFLKRHLQRKNGGKAVP
jgi:hypothetical protein